MNEFKEKTNGVESTPTNEEIKVFRDCILSSMDIPNDNPIKDLFLSLDFNPAAELFSFFYRENLFGAKYYFKLIHQ